MFGYEDAGMTTKLVCSEGFWRVYWPTSDNFL